MKQALVTGALLLGVAFAFAGGMQIKSAAEPAAARAQTPPSLHLLAFGDLMLDRAVRQTIDTKGAAYLFDAIAPWFAGQDIVVANAEGVFSDRKSISVISTSTLLFTFSTSTLPLLKQLGFTALSQANNHALNFGWSALADSKNAMQAVGIGPFGDPENKNPGPLYQSVHGITVAFVGYNQFASDGGNASTSLAKIKEAKWAGAFVIVYPHWGVEYNDSMTALQTVLAHKFIDAGADVVIGSHPHVVEPVEVYKGKAIFYSLGNFIFDQSWDSDVSHGLAVAITLEQKQVSYRLLPFEIVGGRAVPEAASTTWSFVLDR